MATSNPMNLDPTDFAPLNEDVIDIIIQNFDAWGEDHIAVSTLVSTLRQGSRAQYALASKNRWKFRGNSDCYIEDHLKNQGFTVARKGRSTYISL